MSIGPKNRNGPHNSVTQDIALLVYTPFLVRVAPKDYTAAAAGVSQLLVRLQYLMNQFQFCLHKSLTCQKYNCTHIHISVLKQ